MMAAVTRLMSLLNKRSNKSDQDEIILQKFLNQIWLLLDANGCWPLLSHCCWTPLTRLQIAFVSSVLGLYWPFVPPALCFSSAAEPLPTRQKPYSAKKEMSQKSMIFFGFCPSTGLCFPPIWLGTGWTTAIPEPDQYFYPKENIPRKWSKCLYNCTFLSDAFVSPQSALACSGNTRHSQCPTQEVKYPQN